MPSGGIISIYISFSQGMATFPHWHRLYVKQMEDALVANGANVGIPYWDWTEAFTSMPAFATEPAYNSWHHVSTQDMMKDHSVREEPRCRLYVGCSFRLAARYILYAPSHRQGNIIPRPLLHHTCSTGWDDKYTSASTMRDRSYDPSQHLELNQYTKSHSCQNRNFAFWLNKYAMYDAWTLK